jgi:hypothetical protein
MQTRHESLVLELTREKAAFVTIRSRATWSIPPVRLHLHTILLMLVFTISSTLAENEPGFENT